MKKHWAAAVRGKGYDYLIEIVKVVKRRLRGWESVLEAAVRSCG